MSRSYCTCRRSTRLKRAVAAASAVSNAAFLTIAALRVLTAAGTLGQGARTYFAFAGVFPPRVDAFSTSAALCVALVGSIPSLKGSRSPWSPPAALAVEEAAHVAAGKAAHVVMGVVTIAATIVANVIVATIAANVTVATIAASAHAARVSFSEV